MTLIIRTLVFLLSTILIVILLLIGISCKEISKNYRNFPQYTPQRSFEQRCHEVPNIDPSDLERKHDSLFAQFYSPENKPREDEELFYAIIASENGFLTLRDDDSSYCLLLFSSPIRTNYYGSEVLGYDKPLTVRRLSASDIFSSLGKFGEGGVKEITFDKCVHCEIQTVIPLTNIKSADDIIKIWAVFSSTRILMKEQLLKQAYQFFSEENYTRTKSICMDIVECTDIDYPDVHLLLGKCAVCTHDDQLKKQAYDFLKLFKNDWTEQLMSFEKQNIQ